MTRQWRSLDELAEDPAFLARAAQEFPSLVESLARPADRRRVLKLMAAAFAMGGLAGCSAGSPGGHLIPAVRQPPNIIPGVPNFYATAHVLDGYAAGIVVEHQMGRPIKVEGNPRHPASLGATDALAQAQLLDFYDPDRAGAILTNNLPSDRQSLLTAFSVLRAKLAQNHGEGLRVLTGTVTSPSLAAQIDALATTYPQARWHQWDAVSRENVREGATLAYGRPLEIVPKLDAADVILAIDSDILSSAPGHVRFARDFAARRNPTRTQKMSRVYAIEPTPTLIGSVADHRFIAGPRDLHRIVAALAAQLLQGASPSDVPAWVGTVAADLTANQGRAFVHAGPDQPAETHALVHAINEKLGARGATLDLIEPVAHAPSNQGSLSELTADMHAGKVTALLIIDSNPVYAAPATLGFADALKEVEFSLALTQALNETSNAARWAVPMAHPWETWSDARAYDGTASILQPQALPLYNGMSPHTLVGLLSEPNPPPPPALVQATWKSQLAGDFTQNWHDALADGIVPGTASAKASVSLAGNAAQLSPPAPADQPLHILFRPDPHLWDGRYANNSWLLELPRPLTKLTWDNPLLLAPAQAGKLGLRNGDEVRASVGGATVTAPVWIMPGQAEDCAVALVGFGRQLAGSVGTGTGVDFFPLVGRPGALSLAKTGRHVSLASTEHHNALFNVAGEIVKRGSLAQFRTDPRFLTTDERAPELYRWVPEGPAAWAMSIDLNACIGCNACVVACQAENNVPVVGKEQVLRDREMHWLRIDRYYEGDAAAPATYFQPMLCMHCEQAPCEVVCPVGATVHDAEGLNVMVYNRCVGTRFCSNNCPYKVRRFNYFAFAQEEHRAPEARNPDVTVRARGVMEKCTFCLQRIAEARIAADRDNKPIGEVKTACQAACPTQAFTFGNLRDSTSAVAARKQSPLDYALLADQNTHPRVTYEASIRNPNPAITEGEA
jgi:MoCo/4Fe-4S cofactor protein with predicted Tat translocation signal